MLLITLTSLTVSLSLSIILSTSPLTIGFWVLLLALSLAATISSIISPWFGLVIFLIYIGGMLVMFAYFAALTPNQPHEMMKMLFMLLFTMGSLMIPSVIMSNLSQTFPLYLSSKTALTILSPWSSSTFILVVIILFFILVSVVKVTDIFMGPLRPFNTYV
uniref:NADH dehydrogenase subunit 6 n=1 Tax=Pholoe pallida TaxID=328599 RepID=A0A343W6K8_9ANNE|nr:NADH dehydrogenase subunit 6 [Pholoe pallida]